MEDFDEIGYRMHYYKVLDIYTQICEQYGLEISEEVQRSQALQGSFGVKYMQIKDELKKVLKNVVVPGWYAEIPKYFAEQNIADAKLIIKATTEFLPEDSYEIFTRAFRSLNMLDAGCIKDVGKFVAKNIKYMTLDEIITNYDFVFQSKFGEELLDGVFEEVKKNPYIAPDVKAYFTAREDGKKARERANRRNAKKARYEEPIENQMQ